jgi:hypothetical protein
MPAATPGSRNGQSTLDAVVRHLSQGALELHLMRVLADAPNRIRLDSAMAGIDRTYRECQILAVGYLLTGEDGAGRRPGPHQGT